MNVSDLMIRDQTSLDPEDTIRRPAEALESSETSTAPVTDREDRTIGIISERDVLAAAVPARGRAERPRRKRRTRRTEALSPQP